MKAKFKEGEVVKVKSGSPHMTISGLGTKSKLLAESNAKVKVFDGTYFCTWFQDNRPFNDRFQETVLELVEREDLIKGAPQKSLSHL